MNKWNESRKIKFDELKVRNLFLSGMTATEIAKEYNCSDHPVKKLLRKLGLKRPAKRRKGKGTGNDNPAWKGGKRIRADGYVLIWTPDGERLEHQVIMEKYLKRKLTDNEIIHHKDKNKQNNNIENLELTTQSNHLLSHRKEMQDAKNKKFRKTNNL